ncbi:MAG: T9SS type A sorting domain-containing protein [Cytophagales bacterium]|nr:T9SS type A sorting domain-containing protein [Cytophagales bacterium]
MKKLILTTCILAACATSYAQSPTISSFTPSTGAVGTLVTITGTNLSSPTALTIGGDTAIVVSSTADTLVGLVMPGSVTGTVSVTTAGGTAISVTNFTVTPTPYPSIQQGSKLVGTGAVGATVQQGRSVSISSDGNTAIVGGWLDNSNAGAAWVYTRSGGVWTQQGSKLVGTGAVGAAQQGTSVSISSDGNTAIVGGYGDNSAIGAAWVYTRSGGVWTQQGSKLTGTGAVGAAWQGVSVSISSDGNTAIVGGYLDNSNAGAAWVYTRTGGVWTQQGSKLVGTGAVGAAYQGRSVSISSDGNTAIVGGVSDNVSAGAAWVFTRSGGVWTQQGSKLVGTGAVGTARQGQSVSISSDGNTAIVGGDFDNSDAGAAWVYSVCIVTNTPNIAQSGNTLTCLPAAADYQWYLDSVLISGDTNQTYIITQSGNYTVAVTDINGCKATSNTFNAIFTGISDQSGNSISISIYPNPTSNEFTIDIGLSKTERVQLKVTDILGQLIAHTDFGKTSGIISKQIDLPGSKEGVYYIQVITDGGTFVQKVVVE